MCECYTIGGPFVSFDPDCPAHGLEAQRERQEQEYRETAMQDRIDAQDRLLMSIRELAQASKSDDKTLAEGILQLFEAYEKTTIPAATERN